MTNNREDQPVDDQVLKARAIETLKAVMGNLTMRDMLDLIDLFFMRHDLESASLAAVLTALRSDDTSDDGKVESTCILRSVALPISCKPSSGWGAYKVSVGDSTVMGTARGDADLSRIVLRARRDEREQYYQSHFNTHARMAAEALGLRVEWRD